MAELGDSLSNGFDDVGFRPLVLRRNGLDCSARLGKKTGWQHFGLNNDNGLVARVIHYLVRIDELLMELFSPAVSAGEN